jgi:hypothetical protein
VTDNRGSAIPIQLQNVKSNIAAVGPEIAATTTFGRFFARYEFESGQTPPCLMSRSRPRRG